MKGLNKAVDAIHSAKHIAISGHVNPDGDSVGSMLALGLGLEDLGKRVYMISADAIPNQYRSLPGARRIVRRTDAPVDLAAAVDCGSGEMLGPTLDLFKAAANILEVDHHEFRRPFGTIALIDKDAAAVAEIVFTLLRALNVTITKPIAQNLMTSIIVETNSFRLPNTRPLTFDICADLLHKGIDFYSLVDKVFWTRRPSATILSGMCLSRCAFMKAGRLVWSIIRRDDFDSAGGRDEDVDPVPDDMRSIDGVKIAVLFRENGNGMLRVSLRSKGRVNVAAIAEHYNGGGHFDVAGCLIKNDSSSVRDLLSRAARLL
jgi:phosphoesterase RecJ-like protein